MREAVSIAAILVAFVYFILFGAAVFLALETQMHWVLALGAMALVILLRLWPLLPFFAWLGAHEVWGWSWLWASLLALPISFYIASYYWTRITDFFRRPHTQQGV